jgi:hypothetical protein
VSLVGKGRVGEVGWVLMDVISWETVWTGGQVGTYVVSN